MNSIGNDMSSGRSKGSSGRSSGSQLHGAAILCASSSTASTGASDAAWNKVLALFTADSEVASSLKGKFEKAPSGHLDLKQLLNLLNDYDAQLTEPELQAFRVDFDINGNGMITFDQFLFAVQSHHCNLKPFSCQEHVCDDKHFAIWQSRDMSCVDMSLS